MPNTTLFTDPTDPGYWPPVWEDGDTISGEVPFSSPNVWGTDLLLGTFLFEAPSTGPIGLEAFFLGAPDISDPDFPDGLLIGDPFIAPIALMPNNPEASAAPVPEPATILLLASGMAGLGVFGRKKFKK
jgi:hypothetical protein